MRQRLLTAGVFVPRLVVSSAVFVIVLAAVPPQVRGVLFWGGPVVAVLLGLGRGEGLTARVVFPSRPIRAEELEVLAPAVTRLCGLGLGPPVVRLRVRNGRGPVGAAGFGRCTVVLSSSLVQAVEDGVLPQGQAAALLAHAASGVLAGRHRFDAVLAYCCLPWTLLRLVWYVGAVFFRALPFAELSWRIRGPMFLLTIGRSCVLGHYWIAVFFAVLLVISYGLPVCERAWMRGLTRAGDQDVARAGLGGELAGFLRRFPQDRDAKARVKALCPPDRGAHLAVVVSAAGEGSPAGSVR